MTLGNFPKEPALCPLIPPHSSSDGGCCEERYLPHLARSRLVRQVCRTGKVVQSSHGFSCAPSEIPGFSPCLSRLRKLSLRCLGYSYTGKLFPDKHYAASLSCQSNSGNPHSASSEPLLLPARPPPPTTALAPPIPGHAPHVPGPPLHVPRKPLLRTRPGAGGGRRAPRARPAHIADPSGPCRMSASRCSQSEDMAKQVSPAAPRLEKEGGKAWGRTRPPASGPRGVGPDCRS